MNEFPPESSTFNVVGVTAALASYVGVPACSADWRKSGPQSSLGYILTMDKDLVQALLKLI